MREQMASIEYRDWKLDIAYEYENRGKVCVVCLHGLQSNKAAFVDVVDRSLRKGLSTLSLDFVGFGKSSKPEDFSYKIEDQAAIVSMILRDFRLEQFFLVGHSIGGMVGTMLLKEFREKLLGFVNMEGNFVLVDCGASLPASEASFEEFSTKLYPQLKKSLETSQEPSARLRRQWLDSTADYAFYGASKSIVEWSRSEQLIPMYLESPARRLFVYGEQNRRKRDVLPPSEASAEIPNAGHFMLADNPEETANAIEKFLDRR